MQFSIAYHSPRMHVILLFMNCPTQASIMKLTTILIIVNLQWDLGQHDRPYDISHLHNLEHYNNYCYIKRLLISWQSRNGPVHILINPIGLADL